MKAKPPVLLPAYLSNWVREYGPDRVLRAMEEAYYARVLRVVSAHTADMSLEEFQRDVSKFKEFLNAKKP
jgi:hypothetical protein